MAAATIAFYSAMGGYPWGGSEALWYQAALLLRQRGINVHVSVKRWRDEAPQIGKLRAAGCRITRRSDPTRLKRLQRRLLRRQLDHETVAWLRSVAPDLVVISQGANLDGVEGMLACRKAGARYVTIAQAAGDFWWPRNDNDALAARQAYEGAQMAYFVSQGNLALTERMLAMRIHRTKIVRNPFNVAYDASPPWPDEDGGLRLACVARLEPQVKGQDLLIEVLAADRWRRRGISVGLFGSGPGEATLRQQADLHGVKSVRFHGFAADIQRVWAQHHALVLPTRAEGLPLAAVEAALCGRASIVTDVGGNTELIEDGVSGFVAPAATARLIEEAMERAWTSKDKLREMGAQAARRVRTLIPPQPARVFAEELLSLLPDSAPTEAPAPAAQQWSTDCVKA